MADALPYDRSAPKRATSVSINGDLLRRARELKVNLSQALEQRLEEILRDEEARRWKEANKGAVEDYDALVREHGVFSEGRRRF